MRHNSSQASLNHSDSMATGWFVSCLLHGGLAIAAILFVQRIHLAPTEKPFQWNVAMVVPSSPSVNPASSIEPVTSSALTHRASHPSIRNSPSSPRTVQPTKASPAPSPTPIPTAEVPPPAPYMHQPSNESSTSDATSPAQSDSVPQPVSPNPSAPLSGKTSPSETGPLESQSGVDSPLNSSMSASLSSPSQDKTAKTDYGWLSTLMAQWIEGLNKRYPAALRTEGVQGKVTLAATLHEDGFLSDVRVVRSSGNPALDQVALEDVKNGPPITLSRPLERSQMSVKFSISYDLKMPR